MTSYWDIIEPAALTNLIPNPSFETATTGYTTGGTNTITQSSTASLRGNYSLKCTYSNNSNLATYASVTLTSTSHTASIDLYVPSGYDGTAITFGIANFSGATGTTSVSADMTLTDQWQRLNIIFAPAGGDLTGDFVLTATSAPSATRFVYTDGWLVCASSANCTYFDGDLDGAYWTATDHASTSISNGREASIGYIRNFDDDLGYAVETQDGAGYPPVYNLSSPLALQPGSLHDNQTIGERFLSLKGTLVGSSVSNWHSLKQALVKVINSKTVKINEKSAPRVLRVTSSAVDKEISGVYDSGLEGGLPKGFTQSDIELKLKCDDPLFYQVGETGAVLDASDNDTGFEIVAGKESGLWSSLGPPNASGTYGSMEALLIYKGTLYGGGDFTNFDNIAAADYIVSYDINAGTYSAVGTGADDIVYALAVDASGNIYAGGAFANIGGNPLANIAYWDGSNWNDIGGETNTSTVYAIHVDRAGNIYVGFDGTNWDAVSADYIAKWDGSNWSSMGTDPNGIVRAITSDPDGNIYIGGDMTTAGGGTVNYVAKFTGSDWEALGSGMGAAVYGLHYAENGLLYAIGNFTTADGNTANRIAYWNGQTWLTLGTGLGGNGRAVEVVGQKVYAAGTFTTAGALDFVDGFAVWNGSQWAATDFEPPGGITCNTLSLNGEDVYIGFDTTGTGYYAGNTSISYSGTYFAYPIITINRSGGTSPVRLQSIANQTTGAELYFDYDILAGETITIDTRPGHWSVTSDFFGNISDAILAGSNFGQFYLLHGNGSGARDNVITVFVNTTDATITALARWKDAYISED